MKRSIYLGPLIRLSLIASILLIIGCGIVPASFSWQGDSIVTPYRYASIRQDCAPWDGTAVRISLTTKPQDKGNIEKPYLSIAVYKDFAEISEKTFDLGNRKTGSATFCSESGNCQNLKSGKVQFLKAQRGMSIEGDYDLEFVNGTHQTGHFLSMWVNSRTLCG